MASDCEPIDWGPTLSLVWSAGRPARFGPLQTGLVRRGGARFLRRCHLDANFAEKLSPLGFCANLGGRLVRAVWQPAGFDVVAYVCWKSCLGAEQVAGLELAAKPLAARGCLWCKCNNVRPSRRRHGGGRASGRG